VSGCFVAALRYQNFTAVNKLSGQVPVAQGLERKFLGRTCHLVLVAAKRMRANHQMRRR
jgi:hypothetical protein